MGDAGPEWILVVNAMPSEDIQGTQRFGGTHGEVALSIRRGFRTDESCIYNWHSATALFLVVSRA
jgi:hypothetical protein